VLSAKNVSYDIDDSNDTDDSNNTDDVVMYD